MSSLISPLILGLEGVSLTAIEKDLIRDINPVGYIIFARNISNREQLYDYINELKYITPHKAPLICIDQEGGRVQRIKWQHKNTPPFKFFGDMYKKDPQLAIEACTLHGFLLAAELAQMGINLNFTPVLDIATPETADVIGDRAFSRIAEDVGALGAAIMVGTLAGGLWGCIKHIPGHGLATADSHLELPIVEAEESLLAEHLKPFILNNKAPFAMTAHVKYNAWDDTSPATQSSTIIKDIIRDKVSFEGVIIADDIMMQALPQPALLERGQASRAAGCDLLILSCTHMGIAGGAYAHEIQQQFSSLDKLTPLEETVCNKLNNLPQLSLPAYNLVEASHAKYQQLVVG